MKIERLITALAFLIVNNIAMANPIELGTTGKYFEYFSTNESYSNALANAQSSSFNGVAGNLAVINDATENTFVANLLDAAGAKGAWLGATNTYNPATNQENWSWVNGTSWVNNVGNSGIQSIYTNWNPAASEPNNSGVNENALMMYGALNTYAFASGTWNDLNQNNYGFQSVGYVVEYSVPEPTSIALLAMGLLGFGISRRKQNQA